METRVYAWFLTGVFACTFPQPEDNAPLCDFAFQELCGLTYAGAKTIRSQVLDTSVDTACSAVVPADSATGVPELCVISAATIEVAVGATLRAVGSRPLVLAASDSIQIVGTIDASSKRATTIPESLGAGAQSIACSPFAREVVDNQGGASGGAGGSLRGAGGGGGDGSSDTTARPGGLPNPVVEPAKLNALRGGCRGQTGGASTGPGGTGGAGGGSIYLAAKTRIQIVPTGVITANGAGGGGGAIEAGGGGGGSGGTIVLEAPTILHVGQISANGGGGGGGGFKDALTPVGDPGVPGADGAVGSVPAMGGVNLSNQGNGSNGAANSFAAPAAGQSSPGGGGGGGGGVGRIHAVSSGAITGNGGVSSPPVE